MATPGQAHPWWILVAMQLQTVHHHRSLVLGTIRPDTTYADAVKDRHAAFGVHVRMPPR